MLRKSYNFLRYIGFGFIFFVLALVLFRLFVLEPFVVRGASMEPNFQEGNYLWIEKVSYHFSNLKRGEVIVLNAPDNPGQVYIKRVIGLPGERVIVSKDSIYIVKNGIKFQLVEPYVNGVPSYTKEEDMVLGSDELFVMGDNRNVSEDSRFFGPIKVSAMIGRAWFRLLPTNEKGVIAIPNIVLRESSFSM